MKQIFCRPPSRPSAFAGFYRQQGIGVPWHCGRRGKKVVRDAFQFQKKLK
jgi:hypothetical protein